MKRYKHHWLLKWILLCWVLSFWDLISGQLRYLIPEELQLGAFVGNIAVDLGLDVKELKSRSFRIVPGPTKQIFGVNEKNGNLFVKEKIDREQICGPSVVCILSLETMIENPFRLHETEVEILDVNDNEPTFSESSMRLDISEMAAPGTSNPLECAHDPDVGSNSVQSYQLVENDYFTLDVENRNGNEVMPVLVLKRALDREKISRHRLLLIAKDAGVPARSGTTEIFIIVKDANDNSPQFSQSVYTVNVMENMPIGSLVIKLNATDLDDGSNGEIIYSFLRQTSARLRELFNVDDKTGEITTNEKLDHEESSMFELNIQASDSGPVAIPSYCHVLIHVIDMNDNAPAITVSTMFTPVPEDSEPGTVVALIGATDKDSGDNGKLNCQVANDVPFHLDASSKKYLTLHTQHHLDRENISRYEIAIVCGDSGSPRLTSKKIIVVEVSDINDNSPYFSQPSYTAHVMENNVIGASIFSVTALDPDLDQNSELNYSIVRNQVQTESVFNYVHIQSKTGIIFSQRSFDYESLNFFQIWVVVTDSGQPPLTTNVTVDFIILDQNDNAPVIVHPLPDYGAIVTETMSRSAEPGYLVAKVSAKDADSGQNARLSYQLIQATNRGLFTISPDTGEIWTIRGIMSKDSTRERLVVGVKDHGSPPLSASLTIILALADNDMEKLTDANGSPQEPTFADLSIYLVICLGVTSSTFLVIVILLAFKVYKGRSRFESHDCFLGTCHCFETRSSLNGIQKASRNLEVVPNYVEVFGGDPLSQRFRYDTCSSSGTAKMHAMFPKIDNASGRQVKQPNADWHFSQTHRAELNSAQYLEEEGARREIQCEVQREVHRDVQREALRDEPCEVPRNIQRDVPRDPHCDGQRDPHCNGQRAAENDPGGPRKPMCARPPAIPAGRDGWTLPRTAPRMQLQMTLGTHVPGTLRSQYLFPRDPLTPGARISNSSVEFSAFPVGSHHGPWAANQTRDRGSVTDSGTRRPELDTETGGEIHRSPPSSRLPTQRLHSRDHNHALRQIND
ncbi:protocadherin gamma-A8-like isoform X18 [Rhinoraja longicauda]